MHPIPTPQVLDPDRVLANDRGELTVDHESRARLLEEALHQSCSYAQQLWHRLNAVRGYLLASLPPDPRAPGPHIISAAPTGPDDAGGWDNWITTYAEVTSVLCGPHGDSGYGLSEGHREATLRRTTPPEQHAGVQPPSAIPGPAALAPSGTTDPASSDILTPPAQQPTGGYDAAGSNGRSVTVRRILTGLLILLALRGLRSPRRAAQIHNSQSRA